MGSEKQRDPQLCLREGPYLQLLRVGGEGFHFPNSLCSPQDKGQTGQLSCDTGDVHTLQGVEADLPRLHRLRQPTIPAEVRGRLTHLSRATSRNTREGFQEGWEPGGHRENYRKSQWMGTLCSGLGLVPLALTWNLSRWGYAVCLPGAC